MIFTTYKSFSHSPSCITHEALTQYFRHPYWFSRSDRLQKPGWTSSSGLSFCLLCFLLSVSPYSVTAVPGLYRLGIWKQDVSGQHWKRAWSPLLVVLVKLCTLPKRSGSQLDLCLGSLTDLLHTLRTWEIYAPIILHPKPQSTFSLSPFSLSLCLSVRWSYLGFASLHPSLLGISFHLFPILSLQLCSPLFSLFSLSPFRLRFNKSPGGWKEKTWEGGVKTSMALFTRAMVLPSVKSRGNDLFSAHVWHWSSRRNSAVGRPRACNLRWLQRLIKEEWINLEHDINNMTLTALLKPVLLSINSLTHFTSICLSRSLQALLVEGSLKLWKTDQSSHPHYCDSQSIRFKTSGCCKSTYATGPSNCLSFGHHQGYQMYWVHIRGSHSAR